MHAPGEVVTVDFAGATGTKRRPAVIVSSMLYHAQRPDLILGVLTTNLAAATTSVDYALQDWSVAGLNAPSAFRAYFGMALPSAVRRSATYRIAIGGRSDSACGGPLPSESPVEEHQ